MPTIDSLDVKVQAYSSSAIASLDNLEKKLLATSRALRTMNGNSLQSFANGVMTLGQAVNQVKSIDSRSFTTLARNIERLGSVNASGLGSVAGSLRNMSTAISTLSGMQGNIQGISELAGAIRRLGYKSVETAISNMPRLAVSMQQLMASLSKAPTVNRNLIDMTNALANLTNSGYRFSNSSNSMNRGFFNIVSGSNRAQKSMKSFAYYFGKFYANYFLLFRAFGKIKGAMDIASSLTETQNVVNMTFGQMADRVDQFAKSSIKNFGMSELSAKQFSSRFQAMGSAMNIPMQGIGKNFDFINTKMNGMNDSVKRLYSNTDGLSDMSLNLTKLAGDMASFYNVEQSVVAQDLESVFTGMTRPLRKYGLDLTQATLKEFALKNGLDANIKTMSRAEKTFLSYQYVMANADKSMGDFAKTSKTWANQTRMLSENVKALGAVWGQAFINLLKPLVITLNEAMASITAFSVNVVNALGKIFGWKVDIQNVGISQDFEDASDSIDDATGSAKKLKQQLQGIDELNVLNTDKSGSGSGLGDISASGNNQNTFNIVEDEDSFKSKIKDLEELGEYISDALKKAMDSIKWDDVYKKASGFGSGLAKFLNGLFKKDKKGNSVFTSLGNTIASTLNSLLYSVFSFADTFDWYNFGDVLHDGIDNFIKKFDWETAGFTVGNLVKGIATSVYALLKDKNTWKNLGKQIAQGINGFLKSMKEIDPKTGKNGWQITAAAFNSFVDAVIECIREAISGITWKDILEGVTDFLGELNLNSVTVVLGYFAWKYGVKGTLFRSIGNLLASRLALGIGTKTLSLGGAIGLIIGVSAIGFKVGQWLYDNVNSVKKFSDMIGEWIFGKNYENSQLEVELKTLTLAVATIGVTVKGVGLAAALASVIKKAVFGTAAATEGTKVAGELGKACTTVGKGIGTSICTSIIAGIGAYKLGEHFGKEIGKELFPEDAEYYDNWNLWQFLKDIKSDNSMRPTRVKSFDELNQEKVQYGGYQKQYEQNQRKNAYTPKSETDFTASISDFTWNVDKQKLYEKPLKDVIAEITAYNDGTSGTYKKSNLLDVTASVSKYKFNFAEDYKKNKPITKMYGNVSYFTDKMSDSYKSAHPIKNLLGSITNMKDLIPSSKKQLDNVMANITGFKVTDTAKQTYADLVKNSMPTYGGKRASGGVFNGRRWASIDQYASGGVPSHGTHFIAGEKGAEIVGNINNRTEVLNQSQLASVMYDAVVSGMQAVMGSNNQNPIQVFLDGKVVFDSNRQYAADYTRRTGKPAFPY